MKKILSFFLTVCITLGLFVPPAFAAEQHNDTACYISDLTIDKDQMTAQVSFSTDEDADIVVSAMTELQDSLYATGKVAVTPAEHSATIKLSLSKLESRMPETFVGVAYLLDKDSHAPLCDPFTTRAYTEEMMNLKKSTIEDFPEDRVLNLDNDEKTNFAVYNDETLVVEEADRNQIRDNGDGSYTVTNADASFKELKKGDKVSYTDPEGNIVLFTVAEIIVEDDQVTIKKEAKEEDLTDYFEYLKIETTGQNVPLSIDESTVGDGVTFLGCNLDTQDELSPAGAAEGEGSDTHSLSFKLKTKADKGELEGELKLQIKVTLNYYLSAGYQDMSFKIEYSTGVSCGMSGKMETKMPLVRVEIPVLPGINVGFTPAFVSKATGKAEWNGEWKGTLGFSYDTKNGIRDASEAPATSSKVEVSATLFVGVEATPYVCIVNKDLCEATLETEAGLELKGSQSKEADDTKIHKCKECLAGSVKCKLSVTAKLDLIKDTASLEAKLVSMEVKLFDFYYSGTYDKFGYGTCPYMYYRTKISLTDKKGQSVQKARITPMKVGDAGPAAVKFLTGSGESEVTSVAADSDGNSVIYLQEGNYVFHGETENLICEKKAEIKAKSKYTHKINMTMETRTYPVNVIVQDTEENPVSGASVTVNNPETGKTMSWGGKTDTKGLAEIQMPLGSYVVEARTDTYKGSGEITVTRESNELTITVEEIKYGTIHLTAVDGEGNPVSGASISGGNLSAFLTTNTEGKSTFKAETGPLVLHVKKEKASGDAELEVREGEQDVTVILANIYSLTVHAVDAGGNPVENAIVSGLNKEVEPRTDAGGVAEMTIPEGKQCVQVYTDTMFGYADLEVTDADIDVTVTLKNTKFFWTLNGGNLRIFGYGKMPNYFESKKVPWYQHVVRKAVIEKGITVIGENAFYGLDEMEKIDIPDTVSEIKQDAFGFCSKLKEVSIPDSVIKIEMYAFSHCSGLKSIKLSSRLENINLYTFRGCYGLENITIPGSVKTIGGGAFENCYNLKKIDLSNGILKIGGGTFSGCSKLAEIYIPDSVETIEEEAFRECYELKTVRLSASLQSVGNSAFSNCKNLTDLTIPEGIKRIERDAFENCYSLEKVVFPHSLEFLSGFYNCTNLKNFEIPDSVQTIGSYAFYNCMSLTDIHIPSSVTDIGASAFSECINLEKVNIPDSVTEIPESLFDDCYKISSIIIPSSVTTIGAAAFSDTDLTEIYIPDSVIEIRTATLSHHGAFANCDNLKKVRLPNGLKIIEDGTFIYCNGLEEINIPESVTKIESYAFGGCSLKSITIPDSVTIIEEYAFRDCYLKKVSVSSATEIAEKAFDGCYGVVITRREPATSVGTEELFSDSVSLPTEEISSDDLPGESLAENDSEPDTEPDVSDIGEVITEPEEIEQQDTEGIADEEENDSGEITAVLEKNICGSQDTATASWVYAPAYKIDGKIPGEKYLVVYVLHKDAEDLLAGSNVYFTQQETADENGTFYIWEQLIIENLYGTPCEPALLVFGPSGESNLAEAKVEISAITEDGTWQSPEIQVTYNERALTEDVDYRVTGDLNVLEAGEYTVLIKGMGAYYGKLQVNYTVTPAQKPEEPEEHKHSWTAWKTVSQATVFQAAKQARNCQTCAAAETRTNGSKLKPTIQVNASGFPMKTGQTTTKLKVTGLAAGDRIKSWKSSNTKILTVAGSGKLKAGKKTGKVTVTITLASGLKKKIKVTVQKNTVKTTKISVSPARIVLKKGQKQTLKPVLTPVTSMEKIRFTSSNKKVASVNQKGQITAKKKGKTRITIRSGSKKKVITVTVR